MSLLDIFFILIFLALGALALSKGFLKTIKSMISLLVAYPLAFYLVKPSSVFLEKFNIIENLYLPSILFAIFLIIIYSLFHVFLGSVLTKYDKLVPKPFALIPSFFIFIVLFCAICQILFVFFGREYILSKSVICMKLSRANPLGYLSGYSLVTKDALMENLILSGTDQEVVIVENLSDNFTRQKLLEEQMYNMINSKRQTEGKNHLTRNEDLDLLALNYAQEIIASKRLSHLDSSGHLPIERARNLGFVTDYFGENLAISSDIHRVFEGLSNSERHRNNLIQPLFERVGVCVMKVGGNILVVQEFSN